MCTYVKNKIYIHRRLFQNLLKMSPTRLLPAKKGENFSHSKNELVEVYYFEDGEDNQVMNDV